MTGHPPGQAVVSVSRTPVRSLHPAHAQDDDASVEVAILEQLLCGFQLALADLKLMPYASVADRTV